MKIGNGQLIEGENLQAMRSLPAESIDLIYADPPFFSQREYSVVWGDQQEKRSFSDVWKDGLNGLKIPKNQSGQSTQKREIGFMEFSRFAESSFLWSRCLRNGTDGIRSRCWRYSTRLAKEFLVRSSSFGLCFK